ncbi:hypothetical protein HU200_066334 [Digitaria exilis]|uniref:Uncharacterized protein n=1 Tax=Digitaria exilis TaxID=1010633 RepID=A0A835A190_9POAL|nr:hypothetical protein HU200_066334 [Digitaria exilis]
MYHSDLTLFTAIPSLKKWILNLTSRVSFFFIRNPHFLFYINIIFFCFLLVFRLILPLVQLFATLTNFHFFFITLPPEVQSPQVLTHLQGLNFYLSLYEQDPEWVAFIQQELNHNTPLEDIPGRLRLFLMEERTSSLRLDLIQEFVSQYNRSEAVLPLEPYILEEAVRSYLDSVRGTDNFSILQAAYQDLRENERESFFFLETVAHNQDALDAQSASKWCFEEERRIRWEGIASSQARLERAEHEHALLIFALYDQERGRGSI